MKPPVFARGFDATGRDLHGPPFVDEAKNGFSRIKYILKDKKQIKKPFDFAQGRRIYMDIKTRLKS